MKTIFRQTQYIIILILLFYATSFAQRFLLLSEDDYYTYTALNVAATASDDQIIFSGASIKTNADKTTGTAKAVKRYMHWKLDGEAYDSVSGYSKVLSSIIEDTTYLWYQSVYWSDGTHYDADDVDTVVTALEAPSIINVVTTDPYELTLGWTVNTSKETGYTEIWRKYDHPDSSFTLVDSVNISAVSYSDSGLVFGWGYAYKVRHAANTYSTYSNVVSDVVSQPDNQFTFVPSSIYIVVDSTAGGGGTTPFYTLDFEEGTLGDWTYAGTNTSAHADAAYSGSYGMRVTSASSDFSYYTFSGAKDSVYVTYRLKIPDATTFTSAAYSYHSWFYDGSVGTERTAFGGNLSDMGGGVYKWDTWMAGTTAGEWGTEYPTNFSRDAWHLIKLFYDYTDITHFTSKVWIDGSLIYNAEKIGVASPVEGFALGLYQPTATGYFYMDDIKVYDSNPDIGGGSADSVTTVLAINNSGGTITLNDITGEALPFTVVADSTLPEAVATGDTLGITVTLNQDTSGTFNQNAVFATDFANQNYTLYAQVLGSEPGGGGGAGSCSDTSDMTKATARNVVVTAYQDSVVVTWGWGSADNSLIEEVYFRKGTTNACCGNSVPHAVCFDSVTVTADIRATPRYKFQSSFAVGVHDFKLRFRYNDGTVSDLSPYYTYNCPGCNVNTDGVDSCNVTTVIPDTTAPNAPTGLVATGYYTGGSTYIRINWVESNSSDKDSLRLYATAIDDPLGSKTWIKSFAELTTEYDDTTLTSGQSRGYYVTQLDDSSNESSASNSDSGYVPLTQSTPPPNAPSVLNGVGDTLAIHLTWSDNSTNEDSFRVYRDGNWVKSLAANVEAYTDTPLVNNTQYYHNVRAYSIANGLSNPSNTDYTYTSDTTGYAYTNHYVDKNANGGNNGTSWINAWETFSAINWSLIQPGDVIYISGGMDSTIYYETLVPQCQGTSSGQITIIAGKYAPSSSGHSGRVIIDGQAQTRDNSILFDDYASGSPRYITIKGFELRQATGGIEFNIDDTTEPLCVGVIIDSCYIYDWYDLAGIQVQGNTDKLIVQNCRIVTFLDDGVQTDCFHFNGTSTQHARETVIRYNVILNKNQDPLAHNDAIQGVIADGFQVYGNIIVNDSVYSPEGGGLPFILGDIDYNYAGAIGTRHPVILYNNFCYMGGVWYPNGNMGNTMWTRYYSDEAHQPITLIFNNTIVTNGPRVAGTDQEYAINLYINNINAMYCLADGVLGENWRSGGTHGWLTNYSAGSEWVANETQDSVRHNLFWKQDNVQTLFTGSWVYSIGGTGGISGWADWISKGGTGVNSDPLFVQHFGHEPNQSVLVPDLQAGSPAINAGENIQGLLDWIHTTWGDWYTLPYEDIYQNPRDANTDIGAYEKQ